MKAGVRGVQAPSVTTGRGDCPAASSANASFTCASG